jgi:hypothetical protein
VRLTYREQIGTKCRHFKGLMDNKSCAAGVAYDDLPKPIPCFQLGENKTTCPLLSLLTEEELDEKEQRMRKSIKDIGTARKAIVEAIGPDRKKQSLSGTIDCPVCGEKGTLGFRYAGSYNGHIHASCSTQDCVRWME